MGIEYNVKIKDIEPLTEGRWAAWSREIKFSFLEAGLAQYLDGSNAPDASDSKVKQNEWKLINSRIIGTLGRNVAPSLAQELDENMTAAEAWLLLKKRTQQDGIFAKLNAMHCALRIKFTHGTPMIDTLGELNNLIASIYEGGQAPTRDEWSIVLMLNALEGSDYDSLRGHLIAQFQNAKITPDQKEVYDSIAFAGYEHKRRATEQAHIAKFQKGPPSRNDVRCTNPKCKSPKNHATEKCWFEGGTSAHLAPA